MGPPGDSDLHCTISSWTSYFLDHHLTRVQGHLSCTNACPWSLFDHHLTCVQGHLSCTNACPWSLLDHHLIGIQGHLSCTNAWPWKCLDCHLTCVRSQPLHLASRSSSAAEPCSGTPCAWTEGLAPPNPTCSHVLDPHDCPQCDGLCLPDWWKPCLPPPGGCLSPPAPSHQRLLHNQASGGRPTFQPGLKGSATQCQGPVCFAPPDVLK